MMADLQGAKLTLSDSRFIQVIAKSLSISCKEEIEAVRDALTPTLACAASKIGDLEALDAIKEMVKNIYINITCLLVKRITATTDLTYFQEGEKKTPVLTT
ncbi:unnamed protein product [Oncorhynchus mykiss]|uniref:Uncharacterized protein n=1 Tax=Oncorhynchus mykiss TaxID=8022 RepID=A0A060YQE7_ONCMY|nr:unnamed protein product [Oncorhynchus mykiss]